MARLHSIGFEQNTLTANVEVTSTNISGGGAVAISTTTVRSGTYAFRASNAGASGIARFSYTFAGTTTAGPIYARAYFNFADIPASTGPILALWDGTTLFASVRVTSTGTLQLWDSAGQIGSDSTALSLNTQYMVELYYKSNGSSTELNARLEASSFASTTTSTNSGNVDRLSAGMISNNTSYDIYIDDVAINDSNGSFQNSWAGSGKLIMLKPNAAGDNTGLTTGVSDNTNHYLNVDDIAPDDDTTYNQTSTASQIDDYNIDNSGIGTSDTVNVVAVGVRYRKVTSGTLVFNVRAKASASGTVEASSNISSIATTFQTNAEAIPHNYPLTMYDMPGASTTPWTKTDLDTAQIGVATVSNTASNWRVTAIWMLVDYTPSGVVPANSNFLAFM